MNNTIAYKEEDLNKIIALVNELELIPGRNVANAQRISTIYDILNTKGVLVDTKQEVVKTATEE